MKFAVSYYAGVGVGVAAASAIVLAKDGKDSPSKIAYYATLNGLMWPVFLVFAAKKRKSILGE